MAYADAVAANELPRVIRLRPNLWVAAFPLMKLLPARFMLDRAAASGELGRGTVVIESTSGTFGLALAMVASLRSHRLILVSDPVLDRHLRSRLEALGARVEIVLDPAATGGYQQARLDRVAELGERYPDHYVPSQYDNPDNPRSYRPVAELLSRAVGQIDWLVGSVGSGGSMCGTTTALRIGSPSLRAIAVDTHGSVLFGFPDRPRTLRGLGNSILPKNLDHTAFDELHLVGTAEAFTAARTLLREHALFMGPTSGAAYLVACWCAREHPEAKVVALLPDEGHRYVTTVFDDEWLALHGFERRSIYRTPHPASGGADLSYAWDRLPWRRQELAAAL